MGDLNRPITVFIDKKLKGKNIGIFQRVFKKNTITMLMI